MPSAVAYCTVTLWPLACDRVRVKTAFRVPELPSAMNTSLTDRLGMTSSLAIVAVALLSAMPAPVALRQVQEECLVRLVESGRR